MQSHRHVPILQISGHARQLLSWHRDGEQRMKKLAVSCCWSPGEVPALTSATGSWMLQPLCRPPSTHPTATSPSWHRKATTNKAEPHSQQQPRSGDTRSSPLHTSLEVAKPQSRCHGFQAHMRLVTAVRHRAGELRTQCAHHLPPLPAWAEVPARLCRGNALKNNFSWMQDSRRAAGRDGDLHIMAAPVQ